MKEYLGDGCYVSWDGQALTLTTENGIDVTNTIVLEPEVYAALNRYVDTMHLRPAPCASNGSEGGDAEPR